MHSELEELRMIAAHEMGQVTEVVDVYKKWNKRNQRDERIALLDWGVREGHDVDEMTINQLRKKQHLNLVEDALLGVNSPASTENWQRGPKWSSNIAHVAHSALLLMLVATVEDNQKRVLSYLQKVVSPDQHLDELRGGFQDKFKTYMKTVLKIRYDFGTSNLWDKWRVHYNIRNLIAHNGGTDDGSDYAKKVRHAVERLDGISFDDWENKIQLEEEYLRGALEDANQFLGDVFEMAKEVA
jgi:hypothetical protein